MNTLIIYASIHHGNTKEIAQEISSELNGKLVDFKEIKKEDVINADLVGFGSGIYMRKFHKGLLEFVKGLPAMNDKKVFLFSTAGSGKNILFNRGHKTFKKLLNKKNVEIVDEFECLGYDTYGPLKFIGGINKGRPNKKDKRQAREFAKSLKKELF